MEESLFIIRTIVGACPVKTEVVTLELLRLFVERDPLFEDKRVEALSRPGKAKIMNIIIIINQFGQLLLEIVVKNVFLRLISPC